MVGKAVTFISQAAPSVVNSVPVIIVHTPTISRPMIDEFFPAGTKEKVSWRCHLPGVVYISTGVILLIWENTRRGSSEMRYPCNRMQNQIEHDTITRICLCAGVL